MRIGNEEGKISVAFHLFIWVVIVDGHFIFS